MSVLGSFVHALGGTNVHITSDEGSQKTHLNQLSCWAQLLGEAITFTVELLTLAVNPQHHEVEGTPLHHP